MRFNPINAIEEKKERILKTYEELHQLAEPSWKEEKTSAYIQKMLTQAGLDVKTYDGHFGFIAEIPGESGKVIALRADLDALMQEVDGVVRANHSCGHDAHSTMVLFTALTLADFKPSHTMRFIFQPAEEKAGGALQMMKDGALEDVKFLGGIHLRPAFEIPFGQAAPVITHGSTASLKGLITGSAAHASRPENGNNPIDAAALLIEEIKTIKLSESESYSIKITELHSGEATNLIPEKARFTFDLRSASNATMTKLIERAQNICKKIATTTGTDIETAIEEHSPAAVESETAIDAAKTAIVTILGEKNFIPVCNSPGAEDFHFYTWKNPDIAGTMIGLGCDLKPGLHHPKMKFSKEALIYGTKILTQMLLEADTKQW
ncbi:amidohydrolase [Bacillus sp. Marseille-Q3570]|uniref:amidohydrolase n=1 Tax=Bacillus sp. Marseille-Q3570 TaxID=2963522 RepID=UPI0021B749DC|nr:amidohydrolase [Bacillus sp. Marseille-Q3570]